MVTRRELIAFTREISFLYAVGDFLRTRIYRPMIPSPSSLTSVDDVRTKVT